MSVTVNANTHRIDISRGDDATIRYTVKNSSGVVYDVSANAFAFTVKQFLDDSILDALFQLTNPAGSGIDLASAATGIVDVHVADTDTGAMAGPYVYDLQMTEGGKVYTIDQGTFFVKKDVTTPGGVGSPHGPLFFINGIFYILDQTTGLYGAFRLNAGNWEQSANQSAAIPFTF